MSCKGKPREVPLVAMDNTFIVIGSGDLATLLILYGRERERGEASHFVEVIENVLNAWEVTVKSCAILRSGAAMVALGRAVQVHRDGETYRTVDRLIDWRDCIPVRTDEPQLRSARQSCARSKV